MVLRRGILAVSLHLRLCCALVLVAVGVQQSTAYLPSATANRRTSWASIVRDVDVNNGCASTVRTISYIPGRVKTELGSFFGRRRTYYRSWDQGEPSSRPDTSLSMGLRDGFKSILGGKGLKGAAKTKDQPKKTNRSPFRRGTSSDFNADNDTPETMNTLTKSSDVNGEKPVMAAPPERKPIRMGEIPDTKEVDVNVLDRQESVQERINRVKSGKMTPEEKIAFLQSALTAGPTAEDRLPVIKPKTEAPTASASPFPKDSILRGLASGKKPVSDNTSSFADSQRKKKEYLDMISDPGRFKGYRTYSRPPPPVDNYYSVPEADSPRVEGDVNVPEAGETVLGYREPSVSQVPSRDFRSPVPPVRPVSPQIRPQFEPQFQSQRSAGSPPRFQPQKPPGSQSLYQPQKLTPSSRMFQPQKTAAPFEPQLPVGSRATSLNDVRSWAASQAAATLNDVRGVPGVQAASLNDASRLSPPSDAPLSPPPQTLGPDDLGARLGMAAMQSENVRKEAALKAEEERREREKQQERERKEFERKAAEFAVYKQQEMAEREMRLREQRRIEEIRLAEERAAAKKKEEERLAEMMKAQEAFWERKLAAEKASKAEAWSNKLWVQSAASEEPVGEDEAEPDPGPVQTLPPPPAPLSTPSPLQAARFNPDEKYLLEEAQQDRDGAWNQNQEVMATRAAKITGKPFNDVARSMQTESAFMEDQRRKKENIDHVKDEQLAKLKALNSPLPSRVEKGARPMPPAYQTQRFGYPSNFEPQKRVSSPSTSFLGNPLDTLRKGFAQEEEAALDTVDRQKTIAELLDDDKNESKDSSPVAAVQGWGGIFGGKSSSSSSNNNGKSNSQPKVDTPAKRGPIRMKLPLDDDDAPDVKSAIQRAKSKGTSNQDERAKKWGIDISKFSD